MPIRPLAHAAPLIALLLLGACGGKAEGDPAAANRTAFVPPPVVPAKALPGLAPDTPATAYIGHYPNDPVGGVLFFDRTDVSQALLDAVRDGTVRAQFRESRGPEKPIFARGERVAATGCTPEDCSGRSWTFLFDPATGTGEACYRDAATMGNSSRWLVHGTASTRAGPCPGA